MSDVTRILSQVDAGDPKAAEQLLPLVYDELRKLTVESPCPTGEKRQTPGALALGVLSKPDGRRKFREPVELAVPNAFSYALFLRFGVRACREWTY